MKRGKLKSISMSEDCPGYARLSVEYPKAKEKKAKKGEPVELGSYSRTSEVLVPEDMAAGLKVGDRVEVEVRRAKKTKDEAMADLKDAVSKKAADSGDDEGKEEY